MALPLPSYSAYAALYPCPCGIAPESCVYYKAGAPSSMEPPCPECVKRVYDYRCGCHKVWCERSVEEQIDHAAGGKMGVFTKENVIDRIDHIEPDGFMTVIRNIPKEPCTKWIDGNCLEQIVEEFAVDTDVVDSWFLARPFFTMSSDGTNKILKYKIREICIVTAFVAREGVFQPIPTITYDNQFSNPPASIAIGVQPDGIYMINSVPVSAFFRVIVEYTKK